MSARGRLLHNRVNVGDYVEITLRDGWQDVAWKGTDLDLSGAPRTISGQVSSVGAHRVTVHAGAGHLHTLRRVDVDAIAARTKPAPSSVLVLPTGERYEGLLQRDDDGRSIVREARCGACGFVWNDALITSITPTPSGRCPNEYGH